MADVGVDESLLKSVAEQVATEAAGLVRTAWEEMAGGRSVAVDTKSADTDVVTAVDHESERLVRARLAELRPGEPVLGEEGGGAAGDGVTWVVDPIDGTVNFLYGLPWFAVSVAAQVGGVSLAGAVVEPVSGRVWSAARGQGAFLDGRRLAVSAPARLELTLVGTGFAYSAERRTRQSRFAAELRGPGARHPPQRGGVARPVRGGGGLAGRLRRARAAPLGLGGRGADRGGGGRGGVRPGFGAGTGRGRDVRGGAVDRGPAAEGARGLRRGGGLSRCHEGHLHGIRAMRGPAWLLTP